MVGPAKHTHEVIKEITGLPVKVQKTPPGEPPSKVTPAGLVPTFTFKGPGGELADYRIHANEIVEGTHPLTFITEMLVAAKRRKVPLATAKGVSPGQALARQSREVQAEHFERRPDFLIRLAQAILLDNELGEGRKRVLSLYAGNSELHQAAQLAKVNLNVTDVEPSRAIHEKAPNPDKHLQHPSIAEILEKGRKKTFNAVELLHFSTFANPMQVVITLRHANAFLEKGGLLMLSQDHPVHPAVQEVLENAGFVLDKIVSVQLAKEADKEAKQALSGRRFIIARKAGEPQKDAFGADLALLSNVPHLDPRIAEIAEISRTLSREDLTDKKRIRYVNRLTGRVRLLPPETAVLQPYVLRGLVRAALRPIGGVDAEVPFNAEDPDYPRKVNSFLSGIKTDPKVRKRSDVDVYFRAVVSLARTVSEKLRTTS